MNMKISCVLCLLYVTGVRAPPSRSSKCRRAASKLRVDIRDNNTLDLTHDFDENTLYWPSNPSGFDWKMLFSGFVNDPVRFFYSTGFYSQPEHLGTHMDAPLHFLQNGIGAGEVKLSSLIGPGYLINLKRNGQRLEADATISIDDIVQWEQSNGGRMRSGTIVMFYTGYGEFFGDREAYFGTNMTGPDSVPHLHFPGLSPEAADWLISNRCIRAVGIDTASIDHAQSKNYESHQILTAANIPIFENVANLHEVAAQGTKFAVVALPQKITKGTGAPVRIIAIMD